jgi:beta-glucosidase
MLNIKIYLFLLPLAIFITRSFSQQIIPSYKDTTLAVEDRITDAISRMTLEEKVKMLFGGEVTGVVTMPGVPRLDIPSMYPCDGPRGARDGAATVFPSGVGEAATWNPDLMQESGRVIGTESNAKHISMIFGPAMNIVRDPLGGRFFEYFTEDPYLNGKLAAGFVRGLQSQKVAACIKHFACNGRDLNRNEYMAMVDERSLREIYLRGYEICVKESNPWGVMTAANGVNGDYASDSKFLLTDVLKNDWGFKGFVLTDFCNSRSTEKAALAGLDMGMPWGNYETTAFGKPLLNAVPEGRVPMSVIDDKIRRILRVRYETGAWDKHPLAGTQNTPENQAVALKMAEESIVLLKNTDNFLPLNKKTLKRVVVMGPNADKRLSVLMYGGSSGTDAPFEVTALKGIEAAVNKNTKIDYIPLAGEGQFQPIDDKYWEPLEDGKKGIGIIYFNKTDNQIVNKSVARSIDFQFTKISPFPDKVKPGYIAMECEGILTAPVTGTYIVRLQSDNNATLYFAGMGVSTIRLPENGVPQTSTAALQLVGGQKYKVHVSYSQTPEGLKNVTEMNHWAKDFPSIHLDWSLPADKKDITTALAFYRQRIKAADAVIFVGGTDHSVDCEGQDRANMDFPKGQEELITQVCAMNSNTVVVLMHGSPLTMKWKDASRSILDAFYPGMFAGKAIAQALFGEINPSGKLPFSWPVDYKSSPSHVLGTETFERVNCTEGLYVGYRYYDSKNKSPLFPFGYGLSYTKFKISDLKVERHQDGYYAEVQISNIGKRDGAEVVQIYTEMIKGDTSVYHPKQELKGFKKVEVHAGETQKVEIPLDDHAFEYWHPVKKQWTSDSGAVYLIKAGNSSRNMEQTKKLILK